MPRLILLSCIYDVVSAHPPLTTQWKSMEANLLKSCIWLTDSIFSLPFSVRWNQPDCLSENMWWPGRVWGGWWIIMRIVSPDCPTVPLSPCNTEHNTPLRYESLPRLVINEGRGGLFAKSLRISVLPVNTLSLRNWESLERYSKGRLTDPLPLGGLLLKTKGLLCCFLMTSLFWGSSGGGSL